MYTTKKIVNSKCVKRTIVMPKINLFLNFDGNCREAFEFYSKVFGKPLDEMKTYGEIPHDDAIEDLEKQKILHVALSLNDSTVLMGSDISLPFGHQPIQIGDNFSICLEAITESEARYLHHELSAQAESIVPIEKSFWGSLFGMVTDKFGIQWMINYKLPE